MVAREWGFHWDTDPVHTAAVVRTCWPLERSRCRSTLPYLPDLAPSDIFYFLKLKEKLASLTLTQTTFRSTWERASRTIAKEDFAVAFRQWYQRCKKCVNIGSVYVEKY